MRGFSFCCQKTKFFINEKYFCMFWFIDKYSCMFFSSNVQQRKLLFMEVVFDSVKCIQEQIRPKHFCFYCLHLFIFLAFYLVFLFVCLSVCFTLSFSLFLSLSLTVSLTLFHSLSTCFLYLYLSFLSLSFLRSVYLFFLNHSSGSFNVSFLSFLVWSRQQNRDWWGKSFRGLESSTLYFQWDRVIMSKY